MHGLESRAAGGWLAVCSSLVLGMLVALLRGADADIKSIIVDGNLASTSTINRIFYSMRKKMLWSSGTG